MKRLSLLADVNGITGYGLHGIQIARDLTEMAPCYVAIRPLSTWEEWGVKIPNDIKARFVSGPQPEEWELLLHPPDFGPTPGKKTAYFTMHEATKLPTMGVEYLNMAKVVIVPCHWNASCFSACGVTTPIRVVPLGVNTDVFNYRRPESNDLVVFGGAGRMAHGGIRKGINEVIEMFRIAFPSEQNVRLKIKCFPDCDVSKVVDPRIEITQAFLSEEDMAQWLGSLTCFVSAARAEGWGLIQHQAMAVGRPVMTVKFGGVAEFVTDDTCFVLNHKLEPAKHGYKGQGDWAEPDWEQMMYQMRAVFDNKHAALEKGAKAARAVKHLSWKNANQHLLRVLQEFGVL